MLSYYRYTSEYSSSYEFEKTKDYYIQTLKEAIISQDNPNLNRKYKAENCKALLEEYEHLQRIPNKRKRIAEIERREKIGEKNI